MKYTDRKLSECCSFISDGDHLPPPKAKSGIPFITISNISENNQILFSNTMYVPQSYYDGLAYNKKAKKGDILFSVVGSFGKPVYIDANREFVFQRHIAILRPDDSINSKYLYYTMLSPVFYRLVDKLAIGCSQRTLTLNTLRNISIKVPEMSIQKLIANILSVIDRKLANNLTINDNLAYYSIMVA